MLKNSWFIEIIVYCQKVLEDFCWKIVKNFSFHAFGRSLRWYGHRKEPFIYFPGNISQSWLTVSPASQTMDRLLGQHWVNVSRLLGYFLHYATKIQHCSFLTLSQRLLYRRLATRGSYLAHTTLWLLGSILWTGWHADGSGARIILAASLSSSRHNLHITPPKGLQWRIQGWCKESPLFFCQTFLKHPPPPDVA